MHGEEVVSIKCKGGDLLFAFQHTEGKKLPASQSQALRVVVSLQIRNITTSNP